MSLPGSPTKRRPAAAQQREPCGSGYPTCGGPVQQQQEQQQEQQQQQQQQQQQEEEPWPPSSAAGGASSSGCSAEQFTAGEAPDPHFERLLRQLNLQDSSWRGLLARSLQGALQAAADGTGSTAACSAADARSDGLAAPGEQRVVQEAAAGAKHEAGLPTCLALAAPAGCPPASPRIPARRRSSAAAAAREEGAGKAAGGRAPAAALGGAVGPGVCTPRRPPLQAAGTMRQVVSRNQQLIQRQLAAAAAAADCQSLRRRQGGSEAAAPSEMIDAAGAGQAPRRLAACTESTASAAAAAHHAPQPEATHAACSPPAGPEVEAAEEIVARLQCHRRTYSSGSGSVDSACSGGGPSARSGASSGGPGDAAGEQHLCEDGSAGPAVQEQPSQSTLVSFGGEWDEPAGAGGRAGSSSGSDGYEDDFEPE